MARMYAVDRRVYIGEEARPMYNASVFGMRLYYLPADDVGRLERWRFVSQAAVFALFVFVTMEVVRHAWSVWWLTGALLASPLAVAFIGIRVRERYQEVTNPAVVALVHRRMLQDNDPIVAGLFYLALTLPDTAKWIQQTGGWSVLGVATVAVALQAVPRIVSWREWRAFQIGGHAS